MGKAEGGREGGRHRNNVGRAAWGDGGRLAMASAFLPLAPERTRLPTAACATLSIPHAQSCATLLPVPRRPCRPPNPPSVQLAQDQQCAHTNSMYLPAAHPPSPPRTRTHTPGPSLPAPPDEPGSAGAPAPPCATAQQRGGQRRPRALAPGLLWAGGQRQAPQACPPTLHGGVQQPQQKVKQTGRASAFD
jgi:hypothetical protein